MLHYLKGIAYSRDRMDWLAKMARKARLATLVGTHKRNSVSLNSYHLRLANIPKPENETQHSS